VKYVCGINEHRLNATSAMAAAGAYSDINIQRAQLAGEGRVDVLPSVARSLFSSASDQPHRQVTRHHSRWRGGRQHRVSEHQRPDRRRAHP
jgi:hypothetical protein